MPEPPQTGDAVLELVRKSELADDDVLKVFLQQSGPVPSSADDTATRLVQSGILTKFQAQFILQGRHKGFRLGPYRILDQIGAGGMGQVYLAEHVHLHRRVALKVLPAKLASDKSGVQRFYREARAVAALDHPNVVRAYDVAFESNAHFLVLEYIQGQTLEDLLAKAGGCLPVNVACDYVAQAAAGLQHAHEKGISHRDIKPANLLLNPGGIVKILDMGLAKFFQINSPAESLDKVAVMGTADYIAPEQATACSASDHRVDIYSLGATLFHLVTGEPPFQGTLAAKLVAHQLHDAPTAHDVREDVPEGVSDIIAKMMAKEPADRYQTAAEVEEALQPFLDHQPVETLMAEEELRTDVIAVPHPNPHQKLVIALWLGIILLSVVICVMLLR